MNAASVPVPLERAAGRALHTWIVEHLLTDGQSAEVASQMDRLINSAVQVGIRDLADLPLGWPRLRAQLESVRLSDNPWGTIHAQRNLATALIFTAGPRLRHMKDGSPLPALGARTDSTRGRPLFEDETLLLRTVVRRLSPQDDRQRIALAAYLLSEVGCTPREVSSIKASDVRGGSDACWLVAPGYSRRHARLLRLDAWQSSTVRRVLRVIPREVDAPIAYSGTLHAPGSAQAQMSTHGVLDGLLAVAGLTGDDLTASSICRAAAETAAEGGDVQKVLRLLGVASQEVAARELRREGAVPAAVRTSQGRQSFLRPATHP